MLTYTKKLLELFSTTIDTFTTYPGLETETIARAILIAPEVTEHYGNDAIYRH